jgi:hypothetical protein
VAAVRAFQLILRLPKQGERTASSKATVPPEKDQVNRWGVAHRVELTDKEVPSASIVGHRVAQVSLEIQPHIKLTIGLQKHGPSPMVATELSKGAAAEMAALAVVALEPSELAEAAVILGEGPGTTCLHKTKEAEAAVPTTPAPTKTTPPA